MRNIVLGTGYLSDLAAASAVSTASGYDPKNAVSLARGTTWKAGGTSGERLILNTGSAIAPTFLGIANANWSAWGTTKLQHSTDGSTWVDFLTLSSLPSVDALHDYFSKLTAAPSRSWWALYWASPSAAPEVGVFYLGTYTELTKNPAYGAVREPIFNVARRASEGRVIVAEKTARILTRFILSWPTNTAAESDQIENLILGEDGPLRPFWYVPIDESGSSTAGRAYLVRYEPLTLAIRRRFQSRYELGLTLLEEV